ncbi:wsv498 [White spot syndrome virus]|uniref:Wsv498 n=1 Tax=White spot syndrome virus (isolate Shrimp/China/Tongan/1996) TaxID=654913 RepID=Q8VAC7_WSSVS|nr:wsv498 [Shrimp white spot syndrome virus]AAL33499.1 wsv498 [Shrimp white spot syndrome virus]
MSLQALFKRTTYSFPSFSSLFLFSPLLLVLPFPSPSSEVSPPLPPSPRSSLYMEIALDVLKIMRRSRRKRFRSSSGKFSSLLSNSLYSLDVGSITLISAPF